MPSPSLESKKSSTSKKDKETTPKKSETHLTKRDTNPKEDSSTSKRKERTKSFEEKKESLECEPTLVENQTPSILPPPQSEEEKQRLAEAERLADETARRDAERELAASKLRRASSTQARKGHEQRKENDPKRSKRPDGKKPTKVERAPSSVSQVTYQVSISSSRSSRSKDRARSHSSHKGVISPPIPKNEDKATQKKKEKKVEQPKDVKTVTKKKKKSRSRSLSKKRKGKKERRRSRSKSLSKRGKKRSRSEKSKKDKKRRYTSRGRDSSESSTASEDFDDRKTEKLTNQMIKSLGQRNRFAHFKNSQFGDAAKLFVKAGFYSWTAISKMDDETRKFLREDLRKKFHCSALELSLINDIFTHYENDRPRRTGSKDPKREPPYEEIVIPQLMQRWAVDLSKLSGFFIPDQEMTNVFSKEIYEASKKDPPFTPFVVPKFHDKPWAVPLLSHERAGKYWRENIAHKGRDPSQQVSLQAWVLYHLRFIICGDLCNAWRDFGGLSAQLSHLSIVLHLGVIESAAFAISYDCELRNRIQRLARKRDSNVDFAKLLSEENEDVKRYLKSDLGKGKGAVSEPNRPPGKGPKGKNKGNGKNAEPSDQNAGAAPKHKGKGKKARQEFR